MLKAKTVRLDPTLLPKVVECVLLLDPKAPRDLVVPVMKSWPENFAECFVAPDGNVQIVLSFPVLSDSFDAIETGGILPFWRGPFDAERLDAHIAALRGYQPGVKTRPPYHQPRPTEEQDD